MSSSLAETQGRGALQGGEQGAQRAQDLGAPTKRLSRLARRRQACSIHTVVFQQLRGFLKPHPSANSLAFQSFTITCPLQPPKCPQIGGCLGACLVGKVSNPGAMCSLRAVGAAPHRQPAASPGLSAPFTPLLKDRSPAESSWVGGALQKPPQTTNSSTNTETGINPVGATRPQHHQPQGMHPHPWGHPPASPPTHDPGGRFFTAVSPVFWKAVQGDGEGGEERGARHALRVTRAGLVIVCRSHGTAQQVLVG